MILGSTTENNFSKMNIHETRFIIAKLDYKDLINKDFPGLGFEECAEEKSKRIINAYGTNMLSQFLTHSRQGKNGGNYDT